MKIIDLFSGTGGFSLAGHWAGWETAMFCESEAFPTRVLRKNFPDVPIHNDIKTLTNERIIEYIGRYDNREIIVTGGFPCQPFSTAGKKAGTRDDRYLWPEMLRVIREVQPAWVVGENVAGILRMENGTIIDRILSDLEVSGYLPQAFAIPACGVGAIHRRERVWIIAHNASGADGAHYREQEDGQEPESRKRPVNDASDTICIGQQRPGRTGVPIGCSQKGEGEAGVPFDELSWPTEPPVRRADDGIPYRMDRSRLRALGNAIVPHVAYQIFCAINKYQNEPT